MHGENKSLAQASLRKKVRALGTEKLNHGAGGKNRGGGRGGGPDDVGIGVRTTRRGPAGRGCGRSGLITILMTTIYLC